MMARCCTISWMLRLISFFVFFFKRKTADELRISYWSSDVCSSDLPVKFERQHRERRAQFMRDIGGKGFLAHGGVVKPAEQIIDGIRERQGFGRQMGRVYAKAAFVPTRGLDRGCGFLKGAKSLSDHAPHDEGDGHHQPAQWKRAMLQHLAHGLDQRVLRRQIVECQAVAKEDRSQEHTSELQSLMRISYAVFCLKKKKNRTKQKTNTQSTLITIDKDSAQDYNDIHYTKTTNTYRLLSSLTLC